MDFVDASGKVMTLFNGSVTVEQVVLAVLGILALVLVLKFVKTIIKVFLAVAICVFTIIAFSNNSPVDINNITDTIKQTGLEYYEKFAETSENIDIDLDLDKIKLKLEDTWVELSDSISVIKSEDSITLIIDGKSYKVDDTSVIELLESFKKD